MQKLSSKLRFTIHDRTLFKRIIYGLFFKRIKDPALFQKYKRKLVLNYKADPENPRSFNEYLLWIKYHYYNEDWKGYCDKLECKRRLAEKGFGDYLPKTLAVYRASVEINLDDLPERFVLKTNHDCGSVFVCDKKTTDFQKVFEKLDNALKKPYIKKYCEWFYEGIKPLIFAEELLVPYEGSDLADYKFFTFNGRFRFGFVGSNRSKDIRFTLFEEGFKTVPCEYIYLSPKKEDAVSKPQNFDEMVALVERIGSMFDFVRVDLYNTNQGIRIGELTFVSQSGFGSFTKKEYDFKYGAYFNDTIFYQLAHTKEQS